MSDTIVLSKLAHGRAGDKSDTLNISVISRQPEYFEHLQREVTPQHVATVFAFRGKAKVQRYELPKLFAMNFVIEGILDGGVNRSLYTDRHGKSLSSLLLDSEIASFRT